MRWRSACWALPALALAGCGQLLGLDDFEDEPSAGNGGQAGGTGATGGAGSGGLSGNGGIGGGAAGAAGTGPTFECSGATGELELAKNLLALSGPVPSTLRVVDDRANGRSYVVIGGEKPGPSPVLAVRSVSSSGALGALFYYSVPGSQSGSFRLARPGAGVMANDKMQLLAYVQKSWITEHNQIARIEFTLDAQGDPQSAAPTYLAMLGPCDGPEAKFLNHEIAITPGGAWFAVSCDDSYTSQRYLVVGDTNGTPVSASGVGQDQSFAPASLVRSQNQNLIQSRATATYRFGTDSTGLTQAWPLDLSSGTSDTTVALGIAPTESGDGFLVVAGRFPASGSAELSSGVVSDTSLSDLGKSSPSFLSNHAPLDQDPTPVRFATGPDGVAGAALANGGSRLVLHWLSRVGKPRVVSYEVAKLASGSFDYVTTGIIEDAPGDASQKIVVAWYETQGNGYRIAARVFDCHPQAP